MCQWVELTLPNGSKMHDKAVDCGDDQCPTSSAGTED